MNKVFIWKQRLKSLNRTYRINRDFHTHTIYSDGHNTIEENVIEARKMGLKTIAITDHGWAHNYYGIKQRDVKEMRKEIDRLNAKYEDIQILLGIEANILSSDGTIEVDDSNKHMLDVVIAGYHFGSKSKYFFRDYFTHFINLMHRFFGLFERKAIAINTEYLINAMKKNDIFILTHPGDKGPVNIYKVAEVAKEENVLLEVNLRHHHLTKEQLIEIKDIGNKFIISSDAHYSKDIAKVDSCIKRIMEAGIDLSRVVNVEEVIGN